MNCKQGDLAIVIRSVAGNEGAIVRCLKFVPALKFGGAGRTSFIAPAWKVDRYFNCADGRRGNHFADEQLRPIRDQPGEDEMLRIAGKPRAECFHGYHSERAEP